MATCNERAPGNPHPTGRACLLKKKKKFKTLEKIKHGKKNERRIEKKRKKNKK
jgi:hypothetical protein